MSLTLYLHPLASFCHKVLIAFYENDVAFQPVTVDLMDPESAAPLKAKWPVGKIPVLYDTARDRAVPETSIIIEYVQRHYPGPVRLLPDDPDAQLDARLWDRFFDLYVSVPMQKIVVDRIKPEDGRDPKSLFTISRTKGQPRRNGAKKRNGHGVHEHFEHHFNAGSPECSRS